MRDKRALWAVLLLIVFACPAVGQECEEEVVVTPGSGSILISHRQSLYNCCCTIAFDVAQFSNSIEVHEYESLIAGGCDCLCCFDMEVIIEGLEPGVYELVIYKHTEHGGEELVGIWSVTVTGASTPALRTAYLPCVETGSAQDETTWGVVKALYR